MPHVSRGMYNLNDSGVGETWCEEERDASCVGIEGRMIECNSLGSIYWCRHEKKASRTRSEVYRRPFQNVGEMRSSCGFGFNGCDLPSSSAASGIVAQYCLRTCLNAGRRKGLERKPFMPESIHSLTLLSSANAVRATIGAE